MNGPGPIARRVNLAAPPPSSQTGTTAAEEPAKVVSPILSGIDLARPLPPLDYIVQSLGMPAGPGAPHCLAGFGFAGKTVAAQMMLLALSAERAIWKAYTGPGRPFRCTHVDNEQGLALTQRRYQRGALAMGVDLEAIGDLLRLAVFPKLASGKRVALVPEHRNAWADLMADRDLLLVDSLSASRDGAISENASEVRRAIDMLGELSEETKCRAQLIHHANKNGDDTIERDPKFALRGSGGIFDAFDSVYLLSASKGEAVQVQHIKARSHGEPTEDFALVISDVPTPDNPKWGLAVHVAGMELIEEQRERKHETKQAAQLAADKARILRALSGGKRLSRNDTAAAAGVSGSRFSRAWSALKSEELVSDEKVQQGRTCTHFHFVQKGAST